MRSVLEESGRFDVEIAAYPDGTLADRYNAGRFDVLDTKLQRTADRRLEIRLVLRRYLTERHVLPLELIAHPATAKNGHLKFGAAETSVERGM